MGYCAKGGWGRIGGCGVRGSEGQRGRGSGGGQGSQRVGGSGSRPVKAAAPVGADPQGHMLMRHGPGHEEVPGDRGRGRGRGRSFVATGRHMLGRVRVRVGVGVRTGRVGFR